jgi:hypothetical protein
MMNSARVPAASPLPNPDDDLDYATDKGPGRHHDDQNVRGGPRPDQGDHSGRQADQREKQVTEDRPGVAAAESPRGLQSRVHERVDGEQDDQRQDRDTRPGDGDNPDDDSQDAEQDQ